MQIIEQRKKVHLSTKDFLELIDLLVIKKEFLAEDVKIIHDLLNGNAMYDMKIKGEMVPNQETTPQISQEQLQGVSQSMSYFCDKYGNIKGFILGELYFRKDLTLEGLRSYAVVLRRMGGRNAICRSRFLFWLVDEHYNKQSAG